MIFSKTDLKLGGLMLVAVMVGLAVHQVFVAPRLSALKTNAKK